MAGAEISFMEWRTELLQVAGRFGRVCQLYTQSGTSLAHYAVPAGGTHNEELLPVKAHSGAPLAH